MLANFSSSNFPPHLYGICRNFRRWVKEKMSMHTDSHEGISPPTEVSNKVAGENACVGGRQKTSASYSIFHFGQLRPTFIIGPGGTCLYCVGHFENKRRIFSLSDTAAAGATPKGPCRVPYARCECGSRTLLHGKYTQMRCLPKVRSVGVIKRTLESHTSAARVCFVYMCVRTCDLWRFPDGHKDRVTTTAQPSCTRRPYKFTPKTSLGHLYAIASSNLGLNSSQ